MGCMFQWVHHQKALYKRGELSKCQKKRLEEIGIQWIKPKKLKCIRNTKKSFGISKNCRYKNYALGEQVNKVCSTVKAH